MVLVPGGMARQDLAVRYGAAWQGTVLLTMIVAGAAGGKIGELNERPSLGAAAGMALAVAMIVGVAAVATARTPSGHAGQNQPIE